MYKWAKIIGLFLFVVISVGYIVFGRINADEGWYLYASKLVYSGQFPYQDFAFTQTPLLPYVYGLPQVLFSPGLYLGRITSTLISAVSLVLSLSIARKLGGEKAEAIACLTWVSFASGIYFQTIVKTYALTTLFFVLVVFMLAREGNKGVKYILATVFVLLAALTRLSALFFAIPIIIFSFTVSETRTRLIITALCAMAMACLLLLIVPNWEAAYWGLLGNHVLEWGSMTVGERVSVIISARIPKLVNRYLNYFLLWCGLLAIGFRRIVTYLKTNADIRVVVIGLLLFMVPNLTSGFMLTEYFVPLLFLLILIGGVLFDKFDSNRPRYKAIILRLMYGAVIISGLIWHSTSYIDLSGGRLPIEEIREAATVVKANSTPEDEIYALEALTVVVEADRRAMPGVTMAQFSLFDGDTKTAEQLHLVNGQLTLGYFDQRIPKIIILTSFDWASLRETTEYDEIEASLNKNYRLIYTASNFGQNMNRIEVYLLREML
jgi:4-amino-4-deoxy-L-arabinose transferase-like glycosyltransferase